jgi:hypothetical protein
MRKSWKRKTCDGKKGGVIRTLPFRRVAESRGEQSRALVHGGSGAVPVFPPALTVGKSNLFVAAMCGNMVNAEKKSVG